MITFLLETACEAGSLAVGLIDAWAVVEAVPFKRRFSVEAIGEDLRGGKNWRLLDCELTSIPLGRWLTRPVCWFAVLVLERYEVLGDGEVEAGFFGNSRGGGGTTGLAGITGLVEPLTRSDTVALAVLVKLLSMPFGVGLSDMAVSLRDCGGVAGLLIVVRADPAICALTIWLVRSCSFKTGGIGSDGCAFEGMQCTRESPCHCESTVSKSDRLRLRLK